MSFYNWLTENLILPFSDFALDYSIATHLKFLQQSQWWSTEELKQYQNEKLRAVIKHAYENVPYYRDLFEERKLTPGDIKTTEDLLKLPLLTKAIIRRNFPHYIVAKNIPKKQMMPMASSGSTGEPLQYYITKDAYCFNLACIIRGWYWFGFRLGDRYIKLSQNPREGIKNKVIDLVHRCDYVLSQSLTQEDIAEIVQRIRSSKAKTIRGYPSTLYVLADYIKKNGVTDIKPFAVTTTGEILFPHMRKLIESQFNCPVFDAYSGEGGANVFECTTHEAYHISAEYAFTELIQNGERIDTEGKGEVVSTNFWNYAVPFIRYNVKDVAVLGNRKCSCGRGLPVLERIEGRDSDILVTPSGKHLIVHFFTGYFEWVDTVEQFQVVQEEPDKITLKLIPNDKFDEEARSKIEKDVSGYIGDDVHLEIQIVDAIPLTPSGKRRFVISEVNREGRQ